MEAKKWEKSEEEEEERRNGGTWNLIHIEEDIYIKVIYERYILGGVHTIKGSSLETFKISNHKLL